MQKAKRSEPVSGLSSHYWQGSICFKEIGQTRLNIQAKLLMEMHFNYVQIRLTFLKRTVPKRFYNWPAFRQNPYRKLHFLFILRLLIMYLLLRLLILLKVEINVKLNG